MKIKIISFSLFSVLFFLNTAFSQCPSIYAGTDQAICVGSSANLTSVYDPVKATNIYTVASTPYLPNPFNTGALALALSTDDAYGEVIDIGFCFTFYGNTYTQCVVGANGAVSFNLSKASALSGYAFSSSDLIPRLSPISLVGNAIFAPLHDMDPTVDPSATIKYITTGVAPCRKFIISWSDIPMFYCNSMIANQQLVLYETTNIIDVFIKDKPLCSSWNDGSATLGIQNSTGTVATVVAGKNASEWSATNQGYRFSPAGNEVSSVKWLQGTTVLSNTTTTSVTPSITTTYTAEISVLNCGTTVTFTDDVVVTISGSGTTPTFAPISICSGAAAPSLPPSSTNTTPITGTWLPATIDNTTAATYAFTPDPNQCAVSTSLTTTVSSGVTPTFAPIALCSGAAAPSLPPSSTNTTPITGTWTPPTIDNTTAATYTFTPASGQCAVSTTLTTTVSSGITPTFAPIALCSGTSAPPLPLSSTNTTPITGTWTPPTIDNTTAATYAFTPDPNQCAVSTTLTTTISSGITPTFAPIVLCSGTTAPPLPPSSTNTTPITGTWLPATIDNTTAATYTFTPASGQCAVSTTLTTTISTSITPTFTPISAFCSGTIAPSLPSSSTNTPPITGTWLPPTIDNTTSATYAFTPNPNQCGVPTTLSVTVNILPTVTVNSLPVCNGSSATLTATPSATGGSYLWGSGEIINSINVTPAVTTTYSVVYTLNGCSSLAGSGTVTVNPIPTVTVNSPTICNGSSATLTATPSATGGSYLWDTGEALVSINKSPIVNTPYTVVYTLNGCSSLAGSGTVTVNPIPIIVVNSETICAGQTAVLNVSGASTYSWPDLSTLTSLSVSPVSSASYIVTGTAFGCSNTATANVTVNPMPIVTVNSPTICNGDLVSLIATGATTWSWSPGGSTSSTIPVSPIISTTYSVTGTSSGCSTTVTSNVTVNQPVSPTFLQLGPICQNDISPTLNTSSLDVPQITGTWSPSTISNTSSASYTFTPTAGLCAINKTMNIVVNPLPSLIVISPNAVCQPNRVDITDASLVSGNDLSDKLTYFGNANCTLTLKTPTSIADSGTYYIKSTSSLGCKIVLPIDVVINKKPIADFTPTPSSVTTIVPVSTMINTSTHATFYDWVFSDNSISADVSPEHIFPDSAYSDQLVILIAISDKGCSDTTSKTVIVNEELVYYVPNSFTPDEDNFNPIFKPVFTAGYDPYNFSMYIYNRWGQMVFESHDPQVGWDGKYGKDGVVVVESVYTWKIDYKLKGIDKRQFVTGHVNLLK